MKDNKNKVVSDISFLFITSNHCCYFDLKKICFYWLKRKKDWFLYYIIFKLELVIWAEPD